MPHRSVRRWTGAVLAGVLLVFTAAPVQALSLDEARHLLARTGFGTAEPAAVEALRPLGREAAVERLLAELTTRPVTPLPAGIAEPPPHPKALKALSKEERKARRKAMRQRGQALKAWWLGEMIATPSPFTERLTLFWHNHFTSSLRKVKWPRLMYRQNALFRELGAGNFADLLRAVARDPAMLIYLDGRKNRAGAPNENFARELMELFTLGEGEGYTEADIREAARALTGWTVDPKTGTGVFRRKRHDGGTKSVLGNVGRFGADDVITVLLAHPRTARHIVERLWRAFVSETPEPVEVGHLTAVFRAGGYEMRPVLKGLLTSEAFWAPANRGALIKSPVDLAVGTLRLLDYHPRDKDMLRIVRLTRAMGQDLLDPPNVKGWPGGTAWITASTLPLRQQFLRRIARGREMGVRRITGMARMGMMPGGDTLAALPPGRMEALLLPLPLDDPTPMETDPRALLRHLFLDPRYQLK